MFTDDQTTPVRIEILVELLKEFGDGLPRDEVYSLLQPKSLSDNNNAATVTVRAGLELALLKESGKHLTLAPEHRRAPDAQSIVIAALDEKVLSSTDVEEHFARYYSFYLGLGKSANDKDKGLWADKFNEATSSTAHTTSKFNKDKITGLHRWFSYAGLGWYDPADGFQANPYERVRRALPSIFGKNTELDANSFMEGLAKKCPELDGGKIFHQANKGYNPKLKACTLGLSHALIELHLDKVLALNCPADNEGWSLEEASPSQKEGFIEHRFASAKLLERR